jgi:hypothetical protein
VELHTDGSRAVLRHLVATLTYRAAKVLRDAPRDFGGMTFGSSTRTPVLIVAHMADLMGWAVRLARGEYSWKAEGGDDWNTEVARFFDGLATLDRALASDESLRPSTVPRAAPSEVEGRGPVEQPVEKLIQGPLADALTHVGQLAMLRGMAGAPIRPESYARADVVVGRVGLEQTPARAEFDGDASAPRAQRRGPRE